MKILHLITTLDTGGAENMLRTLAPVLKNLGTEQKICCLKNAGEAAKKLEEAGIELKNLELNTFKSFFSARKKWREELKSFSPDLVQTWMYHANFFSILSPTKAPIVWGIRNSDLDPVRSKKSTRIINQLSAWSSKSAKAIIYNSSQAQNLHQSQGYSQARGKLIFNGLDLTRFYFDSQQRKKLRAKLGLDENQKLIGMIARFDPQKNHLGFLRAFKQLLKKDPSIRALFCGEGMTEQNTELQKMLSATQTKEKVFLLGRQDSNLHQIYSALDLSCSSSIYGESFPTVLAESLACGTPCVSSDIGEALSIVASFGQVFSKNDTETLEQAIYTELSKIREPNFRELARGHVQQHFDIKSIAAQYLNLYKTLTK